MLPTSTLAPRALERGRRLQETGPGEGGAFFWVTGILAGLMAVLAAVAVASVVAVYMIRVH